MTEADMTGLMSLVDTSAISRHPHYRLLAEVIKTYHDQAVVIYQRTDHHLRYLLMECPRANETKLFNIPSSEAISRYLQTWIRFTFALLISPDSDKTPYRFPFTEFEKKAVREMQTCFHATPPPSGPERVTFMTNLASAFHSFIRTFLLIREAPLNPPPPNPAKFDSVLECLQVVSAIRPGVSEFTRVAENSSHFTSLVNDSVHTPVMRVSADYNDFTYLGTTLHLPKPRHTVQSAVLELKKRLDDLMMGIDVPVEYPKIWTDVNGGHGSEGYSNRRQWDLRAGIWTDILAKDRDLLNLAMPLSYVMTG
ncbi:hypothetical protein B0H14DRAFT_3535589 [Mycena olivaceomarginata]|nr:hypothetical protein B0H14DRAFT_3535589 [Mycena olivaceomarginata]